MLQLFNICKKYTTGDLVQTALDNVSLNLRDSEFVAVLGPSGSGKTTLLNVIGGLDRYDSGELVINGIPTGKYRSRDWDSYRNHTVGFVFQSYNLIPHQSVLANVELALTISGVSRAERKRRARQALELVGLGDQLHKRPNQMSGGQMQRVAIARALVNDPDIVLADEPTGALDTETSVQIMELLKQVAQDRLVVMVTHNPELAASYANRTVLLRDGRITDDSNPCTAAENSTPREPKTLGKSSMSFLTALSLSFQNLRTKKGRTLLTSFAGSIGIIGIALILSLSTGVSNYIDDIQKTTMASYPINIQSESMDLSSILSSSGSTSDNGDDPGHALDAVYSNGSALTRRSAFLSSIRKNNLTAFKQYLDDPDSKIHAYVGENGIVCSYDTKFGVYAYDPDGVFLNTDGSTLSSDDTSAAPGMRAMSSMLDGSGDANENFSELLPKQDGSGISPALESSYTLLYGTWPSAYDEVVLVLDGNNEIPLTSLYELGILPSADYAALTARMENGEKITVDTERLSYESICRQALYLLPACDTYTVNADGTYSCAAQELQALEALLPDAVPLKIVGVIRPSRSSDTDLIGGSVAYTRALTDYMIEHTNSSAVVQAQKRSPSVNILNGMHFSAADDTQKADDAKRYLSGLGISDKAKFSLVILQSVFADDPAAMAQLTELSETALAAALDEYLKEPQEQVLLKIYDNYITPGTYDDNMTAFGVVDLDAPASVRIYADSFEDKDHISDCIDDYNRTAAEENQITYTDYVGLLMSSVTTIVHVISYVLIAFVAVSLVVSSIMIGIITYISVLERTKEIGILRAIGASKHNISQVFNAETFIIGLCAGLIGIGLTLLLLLPGNALIHSLTGSDSVNAVLPVASAVVLVVLSMFLTLLGGLIPSKKAAKMDPVAALRSE